MLVTLHQGLQLMLSKLELITLNIIFGIVCGPLVCCVYLNIPFTCKCGHTHLWLRLPWHHVQFPTKVDIKSHVQWTPTDLHVIDGALYDMWALCGHPFYWDTYICIFVTNVKAPLSFSLVWPSLFWAFITNLYRLPWCGMHNSTMPQYSQDEMLMWCARHELIKVQFPSKLTVEYYKKVNYMETLWRHKVSKN